MMKNTDTPELDDALARLRNAVDVPPVDPARERALLAAFDRRWTAPKQAPSRWRWAAVAALAMLTVSLNWFVVKNAPHPAAGVSDAASDLVKFVQWPGADALPPFESGSLVRVDLPLSTLPALGLSIPFSSNTVVQADIVIGQDGLARAVRLVQ